VITLILKPAAASRGAVAQVAPADHLAEGKINRQRKNAGCCRKVFCTILQLEMKGREKYHALWITKSYYQLYDGTGFSSHDPGPRWPATGAQGTGGRRIALDAEYGPDGEDAGVFPCPGVPEGVNRHHALVRAVAGLSTARKNYRRRGEARGAAPAPNPEYTRPCFPAVALTVRSDWALFPSRGAAVCSSTLGAEHSLV